MQLKLKEIYIVLATQNTHSTEIFIQTVAYCIAENPSLINGK